MVLMPFSVFWIMASFRWYILTNVSQETTVTIFRVIQRRVTGLLLQLFILSSFKTFHRADYSS